MTDTEINSSEAEASEDQKLGASGTDYPLWRAKEAIAQAEKLLTAEAATLAAHEARATSLVGWLSAEALATVGLVSTHPEPLWFVGSLGVFVPTIVCGWHLSRVFRKKTWTVVGYDPAWLLTDWPQPCELTTLEAMAATYASEIKRNEDTLQVTVESLRRGWCWFSVVPACGLVWAAFISLLSLS